MKRLLGSLVIICLVLAIGVILIIYAQGKRLGKDGKLVGIGILQVGTVPNNASIYLNGQFKSKSDTNIEDLKPGNYTVKIQKDHYHTWEGLVKIKEGFVTPLTVTLFPVNPSLTALTSDGVFAPRLSSDNKQIAFGLQTGNQTGVWVLSLGNNQFFFGSSNESHRVVADAPNYLFSKASLEWSPDNKSILATVEKVGTTETKVFLLDSSQTDGKAQDVTASIQTLRQDWIKQRQQQVDSKIKNFSNDIVAAAKQAKSVTFSKDENSVLIINSNQTAIVQDLKPSPVPNTKPETYTLPAATNYFWYQGDSKHLIAVDGNIISVLDSNGTNKFSLFTGDFDPNAVFSWPDGSKLIISINLNSKSNPLPNLYTISLI